MNNLKLICAGLEEGLIERSEAIRLALLAALSGEHILLLGPPGTAKSQLARKLRLAFASDSYFERLLTRFSVPEELFGPLSIRALEQDRYQRLTRNYLPEAAIAFIDEIFKANSAILNSLLTLLNEREFDNGHERVSTPLICTIAASNELPEEEGLDALYDRFLIRYQVDPLSSSGFNHLLDLDNDTDTCRQNYTRLSLSDIEEIQRLSSQIPLTESARKLLHDCRDYLIENEIYISDRRWKKALKLLKVSAVTSDEVEISNFDCALLAHVLWQSPEQQQLFIDWYIAYLDLDIDASVSRLDKLVVTWEEKLDEDSNRHTQKTNSAGQYLYVTPDGTTTTQYEQVTLAERDGEVLYLAPPHEDDRTNQGHGYTLAELEKAFFDKSFKQTHIDGKWVDLQNYTNNTQNRLVDRKTFEPLVEASFYTEDYVKNQLDELTNLQIDIGNIAQHYIDAEGMLKSFLATQLWLSSGFLTNVSDRIAASNPRLIDFQQRIDRLLMLNKKLKTRPSVLSS